MKSCPAPRVGVVGVGYWGPKHVRVLQTLDHVESVAVIDTREDRLRPLVRSFPSVRPYPSLEAAIAAYGQWRIEDEVPEPLSWEPLVLVGAVTAAAGALLSLYAALGI